MKIYLFKQRPKGLLMFFLQNFDGDGLKNTTGWVKSDDGILVFDHNGNGFNVVNDKFWYLVS